MVYRFIVILIFGGLIGNYVQAAQPKVFTQPFNASSFCASLKAVIKADAEAISANGKNIGCDVVPKTDAGKKPEAYVGVMALLNAAEPGNEGESGNEAVKQLFGHMYRPDNTEEDKEGDEKNRWRSIKSWVSENSEKIWGSALLSAVETNNVEAIRALRIAGIDIDKLNRKLKLKYEGTLLMVVANAGKEKYVQTLLAAGANVAIENSDGETALEFAVSSARWGVMGLLIGKGANINQQNSRYEGTPLMRLARFGSVEDVKRLLDARADVNIRTKDGRTALGEAIKYNNKKNPEAVSLLVAAGAKTSEQLDEIAAQAAVEVPVEPLAPVVVDHLTIPHSSFGSFLPSFGVIASLGVATLLAAALYVWHYYPSNTVKELA